LVDIDGGFELISTAIAATVALLIRTYDLGKDAAERERRINAAK
jgi:hypothetical protein